MHVMSPERSTRSKAKSAPSRPDGDRVKHFLKSVEGWKYETKRQGWWLKKAPDALAYDLSNVRQAGRAGSHALGGSGIHWVRDNDRTGVMVRLRAIT